MIDARTDAAYNRMQDAARIVLRNTPSGAPSTPSFSIPEMVRKLLAGGHGAIADLGADELLVPGTTGERAYKVPTSWLYERDLTAGTATAGGYLAPIVNRPDLYLPALQPASGALTLGAQIIPCSPGGAATVPRGVTGVSTTWLSTETSTITESQPVFGQVAGTPHILSAYCELSRQLLLQAANAEAVARTELTRAAAAALDVAIVSGSGAAGTPQGITNVSGISTFTGASLNQAACRNAVADILAGNANVGGRIGYLTTPGVAETLSTRQRFTGSDRALWEGSLVDGQIEGERALSTNNVPSATVICADWSSIYVLEWSGTGLAIQLDPFSQFQKGIVGMRLLFACDVIVTRASAVSIATSVS